VDQANEAKKNPTCEKVQGALPTVSVIIAVRNEEANIGRCLSQLFAQDYPHDLLEIVLADGLSSDRTRDVANRFAHTDITVRVLDAGSHGRAQGLNCGIRASTGQVILRLDARTIVDHTYITKCVRTLIETSADNVGGVQKPIATSPTQNAIALALSHPFGVGNAAFRLGKKSGYVDSVYLGCFRRTVFDKVGLFDEERPIISEDSDLNQRIRDSGGKVFLNIDIVARYYPRDNVHDLWRLYFRYGGARAGNFTKHRKLTSWRQAIPPLFVLALIVLTVLSIIVGRQFLLLLLATVAAYWTVNFYASWTLSLQSNEKVFLRLLAVFPCIHMAWAFGFWKKILIPDRTGSYWPN